MLLSGMTFSYLLASSCVPNSIGTSTVSLSFWRTQIKTSINILDRIQILNRNRCNASGFLREHEKSFSLYIFEVCRFLSQQQDLMLRWILIETMCVYEVYTQNRFVRTNPSYIAFPDRTNTPMNSTSPSTTNCKWPR